VSKELDRICLMRLLEFSRNLAIQRTNESNIGDGRVPDLSQKGNYNSAFRNEVFNGAPISIDDKFASPFPTMGHLCFDYSAGYRPPSHATVASDVRVVKGLVDCFLISRRLLDKGLKKLKVYKELSEQSLHGDGNTLFELDYESAKTVCDYQGSFYEHLVQRDDLMEAAYDQEVISVNYEAEVMKRYNIPSPSKHYSGVAPASPDSLLGSPSPKKFGSATLSPIKQSKIVTGSSLTMASSTKSAMTTTSTSTVGAAVPVSSNAGRSTKLKVGVVSTKEAASKFDADHEIMEIKQQANTSSKMFRSMSTTMFASGKSKDSASLSRKMIQENPFLALYEDVVDEIVNDTDISNDNGRFPGSILVKEGKIIDELVDVHGYPIRLKAPVTRSTSIGGTDLRCIHSSSETLHYNSNANARKDVIEFHSKFSAMILSEEVSRKAKALRLVELIEDVFSPLYLYARHVALIMELFLELGCLRRTDYFGTYRVDACVTLFDRIVDIHNTDLVLRVLTLYEIGCLYCRVGWLSIFNPMKPEGSYCLDLSRYEERMVVKILCALQTNEPGENLRRFEFGWDRNVEPTPKCELIEAWLTDNGLHKRGIVYFTYYGGSGRGLYDCRPNVGLRRALLQLVLINEEDVVADEERNFSWDAVLQYDVSQENPAVEQRRQDLAARIAANTCKRR
jgi:hypothetical protein